MSMLGPARRPDEPFPALPPPPVPQTCERCLRPTQTWVERRGVGVKAPQAHVLTREVAAAKAMPVVRGPRIATGSAAYGNLAHGCKQEYNEHESTCLLLRHVGGPIRA